MMNHPPPAHASTSRWAWLVIAASTFTVMGGSAVSPILPLIREAFASSPSVDALVALVPGIAAVGTVLGAFAVAPLVARFGLRAVLLTSLAVVAVTGGYGAVAASMWTLLASRFLLGLALAGTLTTTTTWIGEQLQGAQRDRVTGRHGVAMELAGALFFWLAGVLSAITWRAPFLLYLSALPIAIAVVAMPVGRGNAAASRREQRPRATLAQVAARAGIPLLGAFVGMTLFGTWVVEIPFYLDHHLAATPAQAGIALAIVTASAALSGALFARLCRLVSLRGLLVAALFLMSLAMLGLVLVPRLSTVYLLMVVAGLGFGQIMPVAISWINSLGQLIERSRGQAWLTSTSFGGQLLAGLALAWVGERGAHGHIVIFVAAGLLGLLTCACLSWLRPIGNMHRSKSRSDNHIDNIKQSLIV